MNIDYQVRTGKTSIMPFPGSTAAIKDGCTCYPDQNFHGKGRFSAIAGDCPIFYINDKCPLHWLGLDTEDETETMQ